MVVIVAEVTVRYVCMHALCAQACIGKYRRRWHDICTVSNQDSTYIRVYASERAL